MRIAALECLGVNHCLNCLSGRRHTRRDRPGEVARKEGKMGTRPKKPLNTGQRVRQWVRRKLVKRRTWEFVVAVMRFIDLLLRLLEFFDGS